MLNSLRNAFLLLDVAPIGGIGLIILPVLVVAVVILAAAVLVYTIRARKRKNAEKNEKDGAEIGQSKDGGK